MGYRAISFRLNLDDAIENELYNQIVNEAASYSTLAGCVKHALLTYYQKGEINDIAVAEVIHKEADRIIKELQDSNYAFIPDEKAELTLPEQSDFIPTELESAVLNLFD